MYPWSCRCRNKVRVNTGTRRASWDEFVRSSMVFRLPGAARLQLGDPNRHD
ncbi:hypothetical protein DB30_03037 [Enhygromyxa salina]|uniref:Uncharacterized protein n=1 Tax=Enhygromyxa salina TaxID=215803 RepID=A0A0C2CUR1_9BACT|nr:hypothetical protein DB30_03037 [Enhygromyxa salina]